MKNKAKIPPGTLIKVTDDAYVSKGIIEFKNKRTTKPLPPLVEAVFLDTVKETLQVSVIVFLDCAIEPPVFKVNQYLIINDKGEPELQFIVQYDCKDIRTHIFKAYEINFNAVKIDANGYTLADLTSIETFLWNSGPVSPFGIVTGIQSN